MIDRQFIEKTVRQVSDGEISLQQATAKLLASDGTAGDSAEDLQTTPRETEFESLVVLIERLGNPPNDIVDCWSDQLRESLTTSPHCVGRFSVKQFSLSDLEVTTDGRVRFAAGAEQESESAILSSEQIDQFVDAFRDQLGVEGTAGSVVDPKMADRKSSWPKIAMALGIALCVGALLWIVRANSTASIAESGISDNVSSSAATGNVFAEFPSTRSRTEMVSNELFNAVDQSLAGSRPTDDSLETLESLEAISEEEISMMEADGAPQFSLEDLIPSLPDSKAELAEQPNDDSGMESELNDEPSGEQVVSAIGDQSDSVQEILSDDSLESEQPDEIRQPTRSAVSAAIELPPSDQTDPMIIDDKFPGRLHSDAEAITLTLAFPHEVDLSLKPKGNAGDGWNIIQDKGSDVLANIDVKQDGLTFAWSDDAAKKTVSRSLHHGRIVGSDGSAFFLRPEIKAKPWPIRLDQPDMRPTWDLNAPLPPRVTRLSVDFDLPEELEMTWVDPVPIDSPRRARGLAILKPLDGENVSLAVKFDVRCSRKLSCRLRYAARLDSSFPWQLVSRDLLEQYANQLAGRAQLVSREADRLQNVYDMAGTRGKRIIRVKQKYNDGLADGLRQFADRVAELESLIATVESQAALRFRIWVQWPSGAEQTVFASVDNDG